MKTILGDSLVLPSASGYGIKVDQTTPDWPWADMIGPIAPKASGTGSPARTTYRGSIAQYAFALNDVVDFQFHVPHDYVPGTHLYFHIHQGHNGTNVSGTAEWTNYVSYAKRDTGAFPAEIAPLVTYNTVNLTTTPQYQHLVHEIQLSATSPSATQLDSDDIEVDGLILVTSKLTTAPTVTGGSWFAFFADIHYQTTGIGTKNRASPFWG